MGMLVDEPRFVMLEYSERAVLFFLFSSLLRGPPHGSTLPPCPLASSSCAAATAAASEPAVDGADAAASPDVATAFARSSRMPCALGLADSSMTLASDLAVFDRSAPLAVVPRREVLLLPPDATSTKLHLAQAVIAAKSSTEYGGGCGGPVSADACVAPGAVESTSAVAEPGVGDAPFLLGKGSAPLEVPATPPAEALPFLPALDKPRPLLLLLAALGSPSNGVDSEACSSRTSGQSASVAASWASGVRFQ